MNKGLETPYGEKPLNTFPHPLSLQNKVIYLVEAHNPHDDMKIL